MPIRTPPNAPRTTRPTTSEPKKQIEVRTPAEPDKGVREAVAKQSVRQLRDVIERHKDVTGNAMASAGKGDPRITERRDAVSALIAARAGIVDVNDIVSLSQAVKEDVEWLTAADRKDYAKDVTAPTGYSWS